MPDCEICGKPYKSRSGLATHRKTHDAEPDGPPLDFAPASHDADLLKSLDPTRNRHRDARALDDACAALGIDPANVLSFKVYEDKVVIIEGPTGFKRTWTREV